MSHLSNRGGVTRNFAAQQAAMRHHYRAVIQTNRMMQQNLLLSRSAVTEVVQGLAEKPPTTEELQLLAEIASDVEEHDLDAEEVRARLGDTRLWQLLQVLAKNDQRVVQYLMLLVAIATLVVALRPSQPEPPKVTVIVRTDVDKIADEVAKKLREEGVRVVQDPSGESPQDDPSQSP